MEQELIPHLFRTEFSKIAAVLCKLFGIAHIAVAEDIASETFLAACESWPYNGTPANPVAWLYTVAKNKARNYFVRENLFREKVAAHLVTDLQTETPEIDLSDQNITDSQLKMLFAVCHPSLSHEAQVGLALRILCGFGIDEIATAFLTSREVINKRLFRARERLRAGKVSIELPPAREIAERLDPVLTTLYLLFSEGYYSETHDSVLRKDLCREAMRLAQLLIENAPTNLPAVNALMALMCFHASRFDARIGEHGETVLYEDQDEALWDQQLITRGVGYLRDASRGDRLTKYHIEANIAWWHTVKADTPEKWEHILQLYNHLLMIEYSPVAALNRTYALSKVHGNEAAIAEAEKLDLTGNHFYYTLLGELYRDVDHGKAYNHFVTAQALAKTDADKKIIQRKMDELAGRTA